MEKERLGEENIFHFTQATNYNGLQYPFPGRTGQFSGTGIIRLHPQLLTSALPW